MGDVDLSYDERMWMQDAADEAGLLPDDDASIPDGNGPRRREAGRSAMRARTLVSRALRS